MFESGCRTGTMAHGRCALAPERLEAGTDDWDVLVPKDRWMRSGSYFDIAESGDWRWISMRARRVGVTCAGEPCRLLMEKEEGWRWS